MNNLVERVNRLFSWKNQHYSNHTTQQHNPNDRTPNELTNSPQQHDLHELNSSSSRRSSSLSCSSSNSPPNPPSSADTSHLFELRSTYASPSNNSNTSNSENPAQNEEQTASASATQPLIETSSNPPPQSSSANLRNNYSLAFALLNTNSSSSRSSRHGRSRSRSNRANGNHAHSSSSYLRSLLSNRASSQSSISNVVPSSSSSSSSSSSTSSNNYAFSIFDSFKKRERNLLSACCAVFSIAILSVSLVETRWFYLNGGGCNVNYIGLAHFFAPGRLEYQIEMSKVNKNEILVYSFILPNGLVLKNCTNKKIMLVMRTLIAFVFMAIFSSCIGLMLDTFGCMKSGIKIIRRHGIFHILTVLFCLAINGFCFWISELINEQQFDTRGKVGKKIDVSFDVSYYLIVLASGLSILATAFTLIRRYPSDEDEQLERLLEEYTGFEDPVHMERSLPATLPSSNHQTVDCSDSQFVSSNSSRLAAHLSTQFNLINLSPGATPVAPSTPPPPLHYNRQLSNNSSSNSQEANVISEPPPPYDPRPVFA